MSQISICKYDLVFGRKTLVGNHRDCQVCTHLRRDFVPLLFADPLQVIKVLGLMFGNSNLQLPPLIFYGIKVWRLAKPLQDLMCFFLSHSFVALAVCFGSLSYLNTHPRPIFNALALTVHGLVHRPFDAVKLSCPLSRKTPPKHNVSTSMFDSGDDVLGVIGSIPPPPNTASWVDAKKLDFGLILRPCLVSFTQFSSESLANFRRACTCAFLSRGTLRVRQDFSPLRRGVLPIVFLVTMVPAALRSLTRSSHVVLGWFLTVLMNSVTPRGEILHGAPVRVRLTDILCFFHLRIITLTVVTFSPSCLVMDF